MKPSFWWCRSWKQSSNRYLTSTGLAHQKIADLAGWNGAVIYPHTFLQGMHHLALDIASYHFVLASAEGTDICVEGRHIHMLDQQIAAISTKLPPTLSPLEPNFNFQGHNIIHLKYPFE